MANVTDSSSLIWSNDSFELVTFQSCQDLLALNLTWADIAPRDLVWTDSCGLPLPNMTATRNHPVKYLTRVAYPVLLLICTFGNLLTLTILTRNSKQRHSVKWILLMALAFSDLIFLWAYFLPYVADIHGLRNTTTSFSAFTDAIAGVCSFLSEMFIMSSDWILVVFSVERFVAVVFPFRYTVLSKCLSKKVWAIVSVMGIFLLAAVFALQILFDYYWFYFNDDKRCPPQFINHSIHIDEWGRVHTVAVVIIQLMNYILIVGLNTFVAFRLAYSRQLKVQHLSTAERCSSGYEVTRILFAIALLYALTQCPHFIFDILSLLKTYPNCMFHMDDDVSTVFTEIDSFLIYFNYSINFLIYGLISPKFRKLVKECFAGKDSPKESLRHLVSRMGEAKPGVRRLEGEVAPDLQRHGSIESVQTIVSEPTDQANAANGTAKTSEV